MASEKWRAWRFWHKKKKKIIVSWLKIILHIEIFCRNRDFIDMQGICDINLCDWISIKIDTKGLLILYIVHQQSS